MTALIQKGPATWHEYPPFKQDSTGQQSTILACKAVRVQGSCLLIRLLTGGTRWSWLLGWFDREPLYERFQAYQWSASAILQPMNLTSANHFEDDRHACASQRYCLVHRDHSNFGATIHAPGSNRAIAPPDDQDLMSLNCNLRPLG